jgi:fimbrial isopeptide formation D2 family protein
MRLLILISYLIVTAAAVTAQIPSPGIQWQKCVGGSNYDVGTGMVKLSETEFIVFGSVHSADSKIPGYHGESDIYIAKMNVNGEVIWERCYGGGSVDEGIVQLTGDGGFLILGRTYSIDGDVSGHHGFYDIWVAKLDANGNIQWQRAIGGKDDEYAGDIKETPDGGYILTGYTTSWDGDTEGNNVPLSRNLWVIKLNATGSIVWQQTYGGSGADEGRKISCLPDGSYLVAGITTSTTTYNNIGPTGNHGDKDIWLIKLNATGVVQWHKTYGGSSAEEIYDMQPTSDGRFIISGASSSNNGDVSGNHGLGDNWLYKVDQAGAMIWQKCIGGSRQESGTKLKILQDDKILIAGITLSVDGDATGNHGNNDILMVKMLSNGSVEWAKVFGGSSADVLNDLDVADDESSYLVTGMTQSTEFEGFHSGEMYTIDTYHLLISKEGIIEQQKLAGGSEDEYANAGVLLNNKSFIVTGYTYSTDGDIFGFHGLPQDGADFWIVKFGPENVVTGHVFLDVNKNGVKDNGEPPFNEVSVLTEKNNSSYRSSFREGFYRNATDTGTYITRVIPHRDYYAVIPASHTSAFATYYNSDTVNFAVQPLPGKADLQVDMIALAPARPGFGTQYKIFFRNMGTDTVSQAFLKLNLDSRLTLHSASPARDSVSGDTLIWKLQDLKPADSGSILLNLNTAIPPQANNGDTLTSFASISQAAIDLTPADNAVALLQIVTGSYDPNDKQEAHSGLLMAAEAALGKPLVYTIRFQNTGTDTAFNIAIRDTLDAKLDWSSLEMIGASHPYTLSVKDGHMLTWTFASILLVDSNRNEPASHGYVSYRIKVKPGWAIGDKISNKASIYFDFNLPVETNTIETTISTEPPPTPVITGLQANYCGLTLVTSGKIMNLPAAGSGITVTVKIDNNTVPLGADSTFSFNVSTLGAGAHTVTVQYSNAAANRISSSNFTITEAIEPNVNVSASVTTITNLATQVIVTAENAAGGGAGPLYTFARDRNFTIIAQAESVNNTWTFNPSILAIGDNKIYVRMKSNATCLVTSTVIDSILLVRSSVTGITDPDMPGQVINIYPNPFKDAITINGLSTSKIYTVKLFDLEGKQLVSKRVSGRSSISLARQHQATGIYWLSIYDEKRRQLLGTVKMMKQ